MATTGHENEFVTVAGLAGALQGYKTSISDNKISTSLKGAANGVAELDSSGKVPSSQLPSFVDDVIEGYLYNGKFYKESTHTTEITGEGGKIYTDLATNKTYRWGGSAYTQIKGDIVIGTTTGTAADGKTVADHIANTTVHITAAERTAWNAKGSYSKPSGGIPKTDLAEAVQTSLGLADSAIQSHQDISGKADKSATVSSVSYDTTNKKITKTINGTTSDVVTAAKIVTDGGGITYKAVSTVASQGLSSTEKSNARANIGAGTSSFSGSYNDLSNKPTIPDAQVQSDWNATSGMGEILNKPTLGAAAAKGVTDNTSSTAVTSTDTNLITARTLYYAGYTKNAGTVTGVKINGTTKNPSSGVVDLGTVITSHQDISGKADAATTLAGYGITDAKIANGVITLGDNTITPLTSHQDISGKQNKVGKLGSTTKPLYTSAAGTFAECSTYAGGTAVTLNGTSKGASAASFYAPTAAGTSGQILVSAGSGAPSWQSAASVETCESIISELN